MFSIFIKDKQKGKYNKKENFSCSYLSKTSENMTINRIFAPF